MVKKTMDNYTVEHPLRVFTAFSGYDSQCLALRRIGVPFDLVGWSEIERSAIIAHDALFPEYSDRNYGDISKIDWSQVPDIDLFTYSSPCTDFSMGGLKLGGEEGSGTRSSLLWECRKAIREKRPKMLLFENVKGIMADRFNGQFKKWCAELEEFGYVNYYQVLNSKDFGVPQSRERVYMVSILRTEDEENPYYQFPKPFPLVKTVEDILEDDAVPEKYYMSQEAVDHYVEIMKKEYPEEFDSDFQGDSDSESEVDGLW